MTYTVKLPKILCLILLLYKHVKNVKYYNTNDLIKLANDLKPELVRTRQDKEDYKFLKDTNLGGLRGNFSTLLTFKGLVKKNNKYTPFYGLNKTDRLFNAIQKGEIILDPKNYCAYTMKESLRDLLQDEGNNLTIRENQAHLDSYIKKNADFPLKRDSANFPKLGVLNSSNDKYFLRILFNTFKDKDTVEYSMYNYLKGPKIKVFNMHPLFIIPSHENAWESFYVIDSKEIFVHKPLFIYFNKTEQKFSDANGHIYTHYTLADGLKKLPDSTGNVDERMAYDWNNLRDNFVCDTSVEPTAVQQSEFSVFLKNFLHCNLKFSILGKTVVDVTESSSGGADVILKYSGGTTQKLELEHKWSSYIAHGHYKDMAWKDCWLYADEPWDFNIIKKIFSPYINKFGECIPKIFLCANPATKAKEAYEIDWQNLTCKSITIGEYL